MNRQILYILLFGFFFVTELDICHSQNENTVWYFGRFAGIDFTTTPPTPLLNSSMNTPAACASISDEEGNLLFYTNSVTVWDRSHQPMANGTNLAGNTISTQVRIVPAPGNDHLYYIFTTDRLGWQNGLQYSVIDMNSNGGAGMVVEKNVPVYSPCAEKIAVVPHCNALDRWIVSHEMNTNAFNAHHLTSQGLEANSVRSEVGSVHNDGQGAVGYMKSSEDGTRLALVTRVLDDFGRCEIFDFNSITGVVSNPILIDSLPYEVYGLEFSPDGSKLYLPIGTEDDGRLYQINLHAGSNAEVINSLQIVSDEISFNSQVSALQIGPDDKIYLAKRNHNELGVIQNPNLLGFACDYQDNATSLGDRNSKSGLPDRVISNSDDPKLDVIAGCERTESIFQVLNEFNAISIIWNFENLETSEVLTAAGNPLTYIFNEGGTYNITANVINNCGPYVLESKVDIPRQPETTLDPMHLICDNTPVTIEIPDEGWNVAWSDGSSSLQRTFTKPANLGLTISNDCGTVEQIIVVEEFRIVEINAEPSLCPGQSSVVEIETSEVAAAITWEDGSIGPSRPILEPGLFSYVAMLQSCILSGEIEVLDGGCEEPCDVTFVPNAFTPNFDGVNDVFLPFGCDVPDYNMRVYDRWGSLLFESNNMSMGWDGHFNGRLVPEGIYVWLVSYKMQNGLSKVTSGDVVILR